MTAEAPYYRPLEGVRILDLTGHYAGAHATRVLADLGAEVVKIEATTHIDMVPRGLIPTDNIPTGHWWRRAAYYAERNINKLGITLDLNKDEGKEIFYDLLAASDVLAENYTPRVMRHFGFEYEKLKARKPDLVQLSLSGYGQSGPMGNAPANAPGMMAAAGLAVTMAMPREHPVMPTLSLADMWAGISCVGPIVAALRRRRATGEGERIDMAGREAGMGMMTSFAIQAQRPPSGDGRVYATAFLQCRGEEQWLVVCYRDEEQWGALCEELSIAAPPPMPGDPADPPQAVLDAAREADSVAVTHALQSRGVAAAPCSAGPQLLTDPHLTAREAFMVCEHEDPEIGPRPYGRAFPVRVLGRRPNPLREPPMALGRDNHAVMEGLLGYSRERVEALYESGVAGEQPTSRFGRAWATPMDTEAMLEDGGALSAPDYLEMLSQHFGRKIGPSMFPTVDDD